MWTFFPLAVVQVVCVGRWVLEFGPRVSGMGVSHTLVSVGLQRWTPLHMDVVDGYEEDVCDHCHNEEKDWDLTCSFCGKVRMGGGGGSVVVWW